MTHDPKEELSKTHVFTQRELQLSLEQEEMRQQLERMFRTKLRNLVIVDNGDITVDANGKDHVHFHIQIPVSSAFLKDSLHSNAITLMQSAGVSDRTYLDSLRISHAGFQWYIPEHIMENEILPGNRPPDFNVKTFLQQRTDHLGIDVIKEGGMYNIVGIPIRGSREDLLSPEDKKLERWQRNQKAQLLRRKTTSATVIGIDVDAEHMKPVLDTFLAAEGISSSSHMPPPPGSGRSPSV